MLMKHLDEVHLSISDRINLPNREQSTLVACFSEMLVAEGMFGVNHSTKKVDNTTRLTPLRFFVQGTAGVGKSFMFKLISDMCEIRRCIDGQEGNILPVLKVAHQAIAANNIGGITVMKAFRQRPFQTCEAYGSNAKATAELDQLIRKIGLLITDELSMISEKQFVTNKRICSESMNEYHRFRKILQVK